MTALQPNSPCVTDIGSRVGQKYRSEQSFQLELRVRIHYERNSTIKSITEHQCVERIQITWMTDLQTVSVLDNVKFRCLS